MHFCPINKSQSLKLVTLGFSYLEDKDEADPLVISVVGVTAVVVWPQSLHREVHPLLTLKPKYKVIDGNVCIVGIMMEFLNVFLFPLHKEAVLPFNAMQCAIKES